MSIKVGFEKVYENGGLKLTLSKNKDQKGEAVLIVESVDGKVPLNLQTMFDLAQFFDGASRDMNKEKD